MDFFTNRKHVDAYDNSVDIEKEVIESFNEAWKVTPSKQNFMPYLIHVIGPDAQEWKDKLYAVCLRNESNVDNVTDKELMKRYEHRPPSYHSITNCSYALIITKRLITKQNIRHQKRLEKGHVEVVGNSLVSFEVGLFCNSLQYYLLQKNIDSCFTGCFPNDNPEAWKTLPFVTETPIMIMTIGKGKVYTPQDPENPRPTLDEIVSIVK